MLRRCVPRLPGFGGPRHDRTSRCRRGAGRPPVPCAPTGRPRPSSPSDIDAGDRPLPVRSGPVARSRAPEPRASGRRSNSALRGRCRWKAARPPGRPAQGRSRRAIRGPESHPPGRDEDSKGREAACHIGSASGAQRRLQAVDPPDWGLSVCAPTSWLTATSSSAQMNAETTDTPSRELLSRGHHSRRTVLPRPCVRHPTAADAPRSVDSPPGPFSLDIFLEIRYQMSDN